MLFLVVPGVLLVGLVYLFQMVERNVLTIHLIRNLKKAHLEIIIGIEWQCGNDTLTWRHPVVHAFGSSLSLRFWDDVGVRLES
jgi:chromate transport protein ChrA